MAVAHVVGGLTVDQGRMFRSHLLECTACRARVGELRAIAHDLADVERDERRLRTAKRTETKSHDGDDAETPPPGPRLGGRLTLLMAAALTILMALSAWNFVLRGRLQQSEQMMTLLRQSVTVLQDGQVWTTVQNSGSTADGQVSTLDQDMVIMVDSLAEPQYAIYLLGPNDEIIYRTMVEATNGMIYEYVVNRSAVDTADRVLVTRTDQLTQNPDGETTVFEARRAVTDSEIGIQPVAGEDPP